MPAWAPFLLIVGVLVVIIVALTRLSQRALLFGPNGETRIRQDPISEGSQTDAYESYPITTAELYGNVLLSQGLFGVLILGVAWWFNIPHEAFGVTSFEWTWVVLIGGALGLGLYAFNEASVAILDRFHIEYSEELRRALAPHSPIGWFILLIIVLPVIAAFEELLFRGILIGVVGTATGISPWFLAVGSSMLFAVGHGVQGRGGILVTGILGLVLAGAFILTESLLLVIVAHYLVNACEFIVNEGLDRSLVPSRRR